MRLRVWIQPKAAKNEVVGWVDGALRIRLTAPPVEGKANKGLVEFLADWLNIPRSQIRLLNGQKSRYKLVEIEGISIEQINDTLQS